MVEGISSLPDKHRGVQLGTQAEECGLDHEEVVMDVDRIKAIYDERIKGNPSAMEAYVCNRLMEEVFREPETKDVSKVAVKSGDTKVVFEWNDDGHIIDMRFERIH